MFQEDYRAIHDWELGIAHENSIENNPKGAESNSLFFTSEQAKKFVAMQTLI